MGRRPQRTEVLEDIPGDDGYEWGAEEWPPETLHRAIHDVTVRFENPIRNKHSGHDENSMLSASTGALFGSGAVQAEEDDDEEAQDPWSWPGSILGWSEKDDEASALASGNDGILSWAQS